MGQMCRHVTCHLGGRQPVSTNKKYVIQIMNNDYLSVRPPKEQCRNEVLHQATCLVPTKRHKNKGVGGARRGHTDGASFPGGRCMLQ